MAITQDNIFIGSYYRTQFGEVREVTGIVGSKVVYTAHRRSAASVALREDRSSIAPIMRTA